MNGIISQIKKGLGLNVKSNLTQEGNRTTSFNSKIEVDENFAEKYPTLYSFFNGERDSQKEKLELNLMEAKKDKIVASQKIIIEEASLKLEDKLKAKIEESAIDQDDLYNPDEWWNSMATEQFKTVFPTDSQQIEQKEKLYRENLLNRTKLEAQKPKELLNSWEVSAETKIKNVFRDKIKPEPIQEVHAWDEFMNEKVKMQEPQSGISPYWDVKG